MAGNRQPESRDPSEATDRVPSAVNIGGLELDAAAVERIDQADRASRDFEQPYADDDHDMIEPLAPGHDEGTDASDERQDSDSDRGEWGGQKGYGRPLIEVRQSRDKASSSDEADGDVADVCIQRRTPDRYAQNVSDDARRKDLGYYAESKKPMTPDDGRGSVAAAAVYTDRVKQLDEQGVRHGWGIFEANADTGLRTREVLTALQRDNPKALEHPEFKAVVSSPHAEEIRRSGIFDIFGSRVEVVDGSYDEPPEVPKGTLLAILTGSEHAPVHRLSKPGNGSDNKGVIEAPSETLLKSNEPIVTVGMSPDGEATLERIRAAKLLQFGTVDSPEAREEYARKLNPRVVEHIYDPRNKNKPQAPRSEWLGSLSDQDQQVANFMESWPVGMSLIRHYSPTLERQTKDIVAGLDPNGMCMVEGPIRDGDRPIDWTRLGRISDGGVGVVSNVQEADTYRRGATAADKNAGVYFPDRPPQEEGRYTYGLIDRAAEPLRQSSKAELNRIVGSEGNPDLSSGIINNARAALDAARASDSKDEGEAIAGIIRQYEAYVDSAGITLNPELARQIEKSGVRGNALPELNGDLARGLAQTFRERGYYPEAVKLAQKAIEIAPHVDAAARIEKAKALMMIAELYGEQEQTDKERQLAALGPENSAKPVQADSGKESEAKDLSAAEAEQVSDSDRIFLERPQQDINHGRLVAIVGAAAEIAMAKRISPHYVELHKAQAQLAVSMGDWGKYSDALVGIMRDAPQVRDPRNDPASDPSLDGLRDYVDPKTGKPVLDRAAEASALAKLWAAKLKADGWTTEWTTDEAEPEWVRTERIERDPRGSWVINPRYDRVRAGAVRDAKIAAVAPGIAGTVHRLLGEAAPEFREWQNEQIRPLMEIVEGLQSDGNGHQHGLRLTGEAALEAAGFERVHGQVSPGEAPHSEIALYKGSESKLNAPNPEGVSFPWAVLDWNTRMPVSDLSLFFTNTKEHRADLGQLTIIQAGSGGGKSELARNLIKKTVEDGGLNAWVWDVGERPQHRNIGEILSEDVEVTSIRFGNSDYPMVGLGLMEPEPGFPMQQHLRLAMMALLFATSAEEPFPQLTSAAAQKLATEIGHGLRDERGKLRPGDIDPDEAGIADFDEFVDKVLAETSIYGEGGDVQKNVKGFLTARLRSMQSGVIGPHLGSRNTLDIADLCDNRQVVHLDFSDIANPEDRKFLMALLYMKRMEHDIMKRAANGDRDLPLSSNDYFEEGQSVFGSEGGPESADAKLAKFFGSIARQTRGYGRGTVIIAQSAEQIHKDMTDNAALIFMGATPSDVTRKALLSSVGIDESSPRFKDVAELPQGNFLVAKSGMSEPALVHLPMAESSESPAKVGQVQVRNGFHTPDGLLPTGKEMDAAEREQLRSDWLNIYAFVDTLARVTDSPLPSMPEEAKQRLAQLTEREASLVMQLAAQKAVADRAEAVRTKYNTMKLETAVTNDVAMSFDGVPIAGQNPGTGFVVPELVVAALGRSLRRPYADNPPDPSSYLPYPTANIPGLDEAIATVQSKNTSSRQFGMPTAKELSDALTRIPAAVNGESYQVPANRATVLRTILGSDSGRDLHEAMQRVTQYEPNDMRRWIMVGEALGLSKKGDPNLSWFAAYMDTMKETLHAFNNQAPQAAPQTGNAQPAPPAGTAPRQQARQTTLSAAPQAPANPSTRPAEAAASTPDATHETAIQEAGELFDRFKGDNSDSLVSAVEIAVRGFVERRKASDPKVAERINNDPKYLPAIIATARNAYYINGRDGLMHMLKGI